MSNKLMKRLLLGILFFLGLFAILFVGRSFNADTGERNFILTIRGREHFRKGLDVHGGSRLIYKISYEKYEELYDNTAELAKIKATIETIVLKNIDKRISKLGVSDYRSYTQNVNGDNYIIVEIGGVADLEQAKEIIGKTVELEFRLPNEKEPTAEYIAERKQKAQLLLNQVLETPDMFKKLSEGRNAEDINYNLFETAKLAQLPEIYQKNAELLNSLELNTVYPGLLEGNHIPGMIVENDQYVSQDNNGFVFFRILERKTEDKSSVNFDDIYALSNQFDLHYNETYYKNNQNLGTGEYDYKNGTLRVNIGAIAQNEDAYDVVMYEYVKPTMMGASEEDISTQKAQLQEDMAAIQIAIDEGKNLYSFDGLTIIAEGRTSLNNIQQRIPDFTDQSINTTQKYDAMTSYYFVTVKDSKKESEELYQFVEIPSISATQRTKIQELLKTSTVYTIEDVFVKDRESWLPAIDTKTNKILNGAYFKFANIGRSQVGEPVVYINLDDSGKEVFCNVSEANIGNQMAIFVGGKLRTSPNIRTKICGGTAQIEGGFTSEEAKQLTDDLNEGNMPAPLILMQEEKISPTLGENALNGALIAGVIGIIIIVLLMWLMYGWRKAIVTLGVLTMFIVVLGGFMKLIDYALSLSGIAAIILSIGMGVDANILIFERIREELSGGKTLKSAIETGYTRSRAPIKDGNISTGLIALLLFTMGINMFKGFGAMMILNIILILFINVPLTKELLQLMFRNKKTYLKEKGEILK